MQLIYDKTEKKLLSKLISEKKIIQKYIVKEITNVQRIGNKLKNIFYY